MARGSGSLKTFSTVLRNGYRYGGQPVREVAVFERGEFEGLPEKGRQTLAKSMAKLDVTRIL